MWSRTLQLDLDHFIALVAATKLLFIIFPAVLFLLFLWVWRSKPKVLAAGAVFVLVGFVACLGSYRGALRLSDLKALEVLAPICGLLTAALMPLAFAALLVSRSRRPILDVISCLPSLAMHIFLLFTLLTARHPTPTTGFLVLPVYELVAFIPTFLTAHSVAALYPLIRYQDRLSLGAVFGVFWFLCVATAAAVATDFVREQRTAATSTSVEELRGIFERGHFHRFDDIQAALAGNPKTPDEILRMLAGRAEPKIRERLAANPSTPSAILASIAAATAGNEGPIVRNLILNKHSPCPVLNNFTEKKVTQFYMLAQTQIAKRCDPVTVAAPLPPPQVLPATVEDATSEE